MKRKNEAAQQLRVFGLGEGLTCRELFARAGAIADERYPNGCRSADKLADIVREVIASVKREQSA